AGSHADTGGVQHFDIREDTADTLVADAQLPTRSRAVQRDVADIAWTRHVDAAARGGDDAAIDREAHEIALLGIGQRLAREIAARLRFGSDEGEPIARDVLAADVP